MLRVGILGAGGMGSVHGRQYRKMADVELTVFDHRPDKLEAFTGAFDASPASSVEDLISKADIVDICLPTDVHVEVGLKAVAAGRALFVEKPIARTFEDGVKLVEAAQKIGVPFMPGQVVRFFPEYASARALVKEGGVGTPATARLRRGGVAPTGASNWFMDHSRSGGVLLDLAIHDFDWLRWTIGEVKSVYSRSVGSKMGQGPDYALTVLSFDGGCVGHVESTWMDPNGFRTTLEVAGSGGLIEHDSRRTAVVRTTQFSKKPDAESGDPRQGSGSAAESPVDPLEDPYYVELRSFLQAVKNGKPVAVLPQDGLMSLAVALAAVESAHTGRAVKPIRL